MGVKLSWSALSPESQVDIQERRAAFTDVEHERGIRFAEFVLAHVELNPEDPEETSSIWKLENAEELIKVSHVEFSVYPHENVIGEDLYVPTYRIALPLGAMNRFYNFFYHEGESFHYGTAGQDDGTDAVRLVDRLEQYEANGQLVPVRSGK